MMVGFIYVVLTAKPISIRRLCLLYVVSLASAWYLLGILRVESAASLSATTATAVAFLVWISPLVRIPLCVLFGKRFALGVFESVSIPVQFTYGFALTMLFLVAAEMLLAMPHALAQASLIRAIATATVGGLGLVIVIRTFVK
jgi:hypothetical protein